MERNSDRRWAFGALAAVLLAFLFGLPAFFAVPAQRVLFAPDTYGAILEEQGVYERYPAWLADLLGIPPIPVTGEAGQVVGTLDSSRYETLVRSVFPETWVRGEVEGLFDQLFAYLNSEAETLRLEVDLRPVKENLSGPGAPRIASIIVEGLPSCTTEDLLAFAMQALSGTVQGLPLCQPPQEFLGVLDSLAGGLVQSLASSLPDTVDVARTGQIAGLLRGGDGEGGAAGWVRWYRMARSASPVLPWLALACAIAAGGLGWKTRKGAPFWLGLAVLLPAVAAAVIALLLGLWSSSVLTAGAGFLLPGVLGDILADLVQAVSRRYFGEVLRWSLIVAVVGAAVFGGRYLLRGKRQTE